VLLNAIVDLTAFCTRRAWVVVVAALVLAAAGGVYTARHLTVDTDTDRLFANSLRWRQAQVAQARNFPQFSQIIVAVVRGATPEETEETARALNAAAARDAAHFQNSSYPAGAAFYRRNGLLLLPVKQIARLLNSIIAAQPVLGELAADPSSRGLFSALGLIAQGASAGQADLRAYDATLRGLQAALEQAAAGHPEPLSWQALLATGLGQPNVAFVLIHPVLVPNTLQPGGPATAALLRLAAALPDVAAGRARVDYTGPVPLADEQFASLTQGLVAGGIAGIILISLWLFLALRSWRLILPIIATLLLGLMFTITFAAAAIGVMNLISVAFAILFIGLAVDFAIQFCVRLRDVRRATPDLRLAISQTARQAGGQIALAAIATACGFLAFAPTAFVGVAELGIIAGAGMGIAFFCTVTFLPALLVLFRPRADFAAIGLPFARPLDDFLRRRRRSVLLAFGVLAAAGLAAAFTIKFDANPLDTKDPATESMRTLSLLLDNPATNPFYAETMAPDLAAARVLSAKLSARPEVLQVISGATFIPTEQTLKLAMVAQAQNILAPTLQASQTSPPAAPTAADIRLAMRMARDEILKAAPELPPHSALSGIGAAINQLLAQSDANLLAMNAAVSRFLPAELDALNASLSPNAITAQNLPPEIARDWFLPDGEVRVEALPTRAAQSTAGLRRFAAAVLAVAPNAGGPAITTIASANTILGAFRQAALLATLAIALIIFCVFRNLRDMALVLATLALSALLTALFAKFAGLAINYANIIALPLLLGVGVSFNVYFVMNFRARVRRYLSSATAHAVLFSALTTGTAFGTLAASHDRGTASMGFLLLLSLAAVLICTFLFLPALLYMLRPDDAGEA
jgi:hopanoid biosynthesis associated RND transporter like protein HpnN